VITVSDTGIGIAPEALPQVFDMFVQGHARDRRAQSGLGIGLTLVRSLVEMHGGSVRARSAGADRGSEFVVRLPLARPDAPRVLAGAEDVPGKIPGLPRVMVVDDNRDAADSLCMLLQLDGHDVHVAYDGASALDQTARLRPQVVLLDIGMPGMNGYEVAMRLRATPAHHGALLVALTGWGQDEDKRRAMAAGFDHHLTKPVDPAQLLRLIG